MQHAATEVAANGVATLALCGAHALNIIGTPEIVALTGALEQLAARDDVRVLVLRGAGDRAFIGGADINEMAALEPASAEVFIRRLAALCESVRGFPAPVIARLAGWTLGGGLEVAACCDLRIAAEDARFGMPEVAVGIPSVIHAVLLPRLIGNARATQLILAAESIGAPTAFEWGLVHETHPLGQLDTRINALAARLAGFGPAVLRQQKRLLREWESLPPDAAIERTIAEFGRAFATGEPHRYMQEFRNRKKP